MVRDDGRRSVGDHRTRRAPSARSARGPTRRASGTLAAPWAARPDIPIGRSPTAIGTLFSAAIEGPWCYLEFGDVELVSRPRAPRPAPARGCAEDRREEAGQPSAADSRAAPESAQAQRCARSARADTARATARSSSPCRPTARRATRSTKQARCSSALCQRQRSHRAAAVRRPRRPSSAPAAEPGRGWSGWC